MTLHKEEPKIEPILNTPFAADRLLKQPFVEPKLTWVEPMLVQQGMLTAEAQGGGFFGSFSP